MNPPVQPAPITTQPGASTAIDMYGNRNWSNSLCSCMDDTRTCAFVLFCTPCSVCSMSKRLGDCGAMPLCVPGAVIAMRARLRTLTGIRGSICDDCITMSFCQLCAVCQMVREMDQMGI